MVRPRPPKAALLASADDVEAQFYDALQQGDLAQLMAVWADDDDVVCVHPGGPRLVGGAAISASFEAIFAHGAVAAQPEQVRRVQGIGFAVHHLVERIRVAEGGQEKSVWVLATNVYVNTPQGWRLVAHHASPGAAVAPASAGEAPSTLH